MNTIVALDAARLLVCDRPPGWFGCACFCISLYRKVKSDALPCGTGGWPSWLLILSFTYSFRVPLPEAVLSNSGWSSFWSSLSSFGSPRKLYSLLLKSAIAVAVGVWVVSLMLIRSGHPAAFERPTPRPLFLAAHSRTPQHTLAPHPCQPRRADSESTHLSCIRVLLHGRAGYGGRSARSQT